jgi:hypothetical protein
MVRRVVTANGLNGRSYFAADETIRDTALWLTGGADPLGASPDGAPAVLLPSTAPHIEPPPGGSRCVQSAIPPWAVMQPMFESGRIPGHDAGGFHRTMTVDYIILIDGPLTLILDDGETTLHAGDLVVQRNTLHSWRNDGPEPVRFWAAMIKLDQNSG